MSKAGAKARHSVRNWRFYVPAHGTRASNRDPRAACDITKLLGKLPRNVSDHENHQCFRADLLCTVLRSATQSGDREVSENGPGGRRQNAQFPDTVSRETDGGPTAGDADSSPLRVASTAVVVASVVS
jgi:hypothetical protein